MEPDGLLILCDDDGTPIYTRPGLIRCIGHLGEGKPSEV